MKYTAKFRNRESFLYKLFRIGLIPGLGTILILTAVFLPIMRNIARNHDQYYEQILTYAVSSQFEQVGDSAERMRQKLASSGWFHDIFIEHCLYGEPVSVTTRQTVRKDLNLWLAQEEHILYMSFRFYQWENELYSSTGVYMDQAFFQELFPDAVQYQFFSGPEGFFTVDFGGQTYLGCRAPVSDIPGGAAKGEMNLLFDAGAIGRQLDYLTEGKCAAFHLTTPEGELLWSYEVEGREGRAVPLRTASLSGGYHYQVDVSENFHSQSSRRVLPVFLLTDGVCILLCVAAALVLAFLEFRPIDTIVHKFPPGDEPARNEIETLSRAVDRILQEKLETAAAMDGLRLLARQNLLSGLLSGTSAFSDAAPGAAGQGVTFHYPLFCAVACRLPFSACGLSQPAETVMEVLVEHSREDLALDAYLYYEDSDHYRILTNFAGQRDLDLYLEQLSENCEQYLGEAGAPRFGVGETVRERRELYRSNEQSANALRFAAGEEATVYFREIASRVLSGYYYPFSMELLLSRAVLDGNEEGARSILRDIIRANGEQHGGGPSAPLYTDLFSTVLRSAQSLGITLDNWFFIAGKPAQLPDIQQRMEQMIGCVCRQLESRRPAPAEDDVNVRILDYIERNLFQPDLSLAGIAGAFDKTTSYVSLLFKRSKGVNYSDYVNQARINKAIELMVNEQKNAKEACEAVGYISYFTFRRNFIKYTNMSPSEFRAGNQAEPEDG